MYIAGGSAASNSLDVGGGAVLDITAPASRGGRCRGTGGGGRGRGSARGSGDTTERPQRSSSSAASAVSSMASCAAMPGSNVGDGIGTMSLAQSARQSVHGGIDAAPRDSAAGRQSSAMSRARSPAPRMGMSSPEVERRLLLPGLHGGGASFRGPAANQGGEPDAPTIENKPYLDCNALIRFASHGKRVVQGVIATVLELCTCNL